MMAKCKTLLDKLTRTPDFGLESHFVLPVSPIEVTLAALAVPEITFCSAAVLLHTWSCGRRSSAYQLLWRRLLSDTGSGSVESLSARKNIFPNPQNAFYTSIQDKTTESTWSHFLAIVPPLSLQGSRLVHLAVKSSHWSFSIWMCIKSRGIKNHPCFFSCVT